MTYISVELRNLVKDLSGGCCEYCLLNQEDSPFSFHFEHIIAEKHGGETTIENLCWSCPECNAWKGSDISSIDRATGLLTPLFNPRLQVWSEHFRLNGAIIEPISQEGRVTTVLLQLNRAEALVERANLIKLGRYPCLKNI